MKQSAIAHANIALVKYWGKGDPVLRTPLNSSLAVGLDKIYTHTTVEFLEDLEEDEISIVADSFSDKEIKRIQKQLDRIRQKASINTKAKVLTKNNFPKGAGAASSASGFAAFTTAAATAAGLDLNKKKLSVLARQGSGSACRSITGEMSVWHKGTSSKTSYAEVIDYPKNWDMRILLVFVGDLKAKKVGSTEGMARANTSPYFKQSLIEAEKNIQLMKQALAEEDWLSYGNIIEKETYRLHSICMTSDPAILYWTKETIDIFHMLYRLREKGIYAFFTVDAGPHVHIVCKAKDRKEINQELKTIKGISSVANCKIGKGSKIVNEHLF